MNENLTIMKKRVIEDRGSELIAWPSEGAAQRRDRSQMLHRSRLEGGLRYLSRREAAELTGIPEQTLYFASRRGDIAAISAGAHATLLEVDSLLRYAATWPRSTRPAGASAPPDLPADELCSNCQRAAAVVRGLCMTCYQYQYRNNGQPRPAHLYEDTDDDDRSA